MSKASSAARSLSTKAAAVLVLATALIVGACSYGWAKTQPTGTRTAFNADAVAAGDALVVRGGVVRLGSEIYTHNYTNHASMGITVDSLENGCTLVLGTTFVPGRDYIISAQVDEDETISRLGIQAGVRGGGETTKVYLYKDGREICANDPRFGTSSNLWVSLIAVRADKAAGSARR